MVGTQSKLDNPFKAGKKTEENWINFEIQNFFYIKLKTEKKNGKLSTCAIFLLDFQHFVKTSHVSFIAKKKIDNFHTKYILLKVFIF